MLLDWERRGLVSAAYLLSVGGRSGGASSSPLLSIFFALVNDHQNDSPAHPTMIVAPPHLVWQWVSELRAISGHLFLYLGSQKGIIECQQ